MLDTINIPDCVRCNDCHCDLSKHKHSIDVFCQSIIKCCLDVSKGCIPTAGLKTEKENSGFIYDIMKRTRHQYHYAVRCCKKNKLKIQKEKLAKNISHTKDFCMELKKKIMLTK